MTFDLGKAMRRKEEHKSARLEDFAFHRRVRATRMLAAELGYDTVAIARWVAGFAERALIEHLANLTGHPTEQIAAWYHACLTRAHAELVAERGDPTPHRLA